MSLLRTETRFAPQASAKNVRSNELETQKADRFQGQRDGELLGTSLKYGSNIVKALDVEHASGSARSR